MDAEALVRVSVIIARSCVGETTWDSLAAFTAETGTRA